MFTKEKVGSRTSHQKHTVCYCTTGKVTKKFIVASCTSEILLRNKCSLHYKWYIIKSVVQREQVSPALGPDQFLSAHQTTWPYISWFGLGEGWGGGRGAAGSRCNPDMVQRGRIWNTSRVIFNMMRCYRSESHDQRAASHHDTGSLPCSFAPWVFARLGWPSSSAETTNKRRFQLQILLYALLQRTAQTEVSPPAFPSTSSRRLAVDSAVPNLKRTFVQEENTSFGVNRLTRTGFWQIVRIRVMLQQDLPFGFSPLCLFRKCSGNFKKFLSCRCRIESKETTQTTWTSKRKQFYRPQVTITATCQHVLLLPTWGLSLVLRRVF